MGRLYAIAVLMVLFPWSGQGQPSYKLLDQRGQEVGWDTVSALADKRPFVFFGEIHDQEIGHQAQLKLLQHLQSQYPNRVLLGMEMFEADTQPILDEYFGDLINQRSFEREARLWDNYQRDYKPLVEFAKTHRIKLLATNIPRRYANSVYHQGLGILDSLSDYAKQFLPPLPVHIDTEISIYQEMADSVPGHDSKNMIHAQAIKDATMAHFILAHKTSDNIILHLNGAYHSKNGEGIPSFLYHYSGDQPQVLVIHSILEENKEEHDLKSVDFTLVITPGDDIEPK